MLWIIMLFGPFHFVHGMDHFGSIFYVLLTPTKPPVEHIYNDEGYFVTVPSRIASIKLTTLPCSLVALPFCAIYEPFASSDSGGILSNSWDASSGVLYSVGGLPFYCVKKILWDAPCYLYDSMFGDDEGGKIEAHKRNPIKIPSAPPKPKDTTDN